MPGNRITRLVIFIGTLFPQLVVAQEAENAGYFAEELLFRDDKTEIPPEVFETQTGLINQPVNLNSATADQLSETGFFTPFQVQSLIRYREEFGPIYSVFELAGITGFKNIPLGEIPPNLVVEAGVSSKTNHPGRELLLLTGSRIFPESSGYRSRESSGGIPAYSGTPVRTSLRLRKNLGKKVAMGLSYDKDPGEKYLNGLRPEFVSGYLHYSGKLALKQLILGDFQLHHGLGLVNGSGFMHLSGNHPFERTRYFSAETLCLPRGNHV